MYKIYNKKQELFKLNPRLSLLCRNTSIIHITANFAIVLRSKPIT